MHGLCFLFFFFFFPLRFCRVVAVSHESCCICLVSCSGRFCALCTRTPDQCHNHEQWGKRERMKEHDCGTGTRQKIKSLQARLHDMGTSRQNGSTSLLLWYKVKQEHADIRFVCFINWLNFNFVYGSNRLNIALNEDMCHYEWRHSTATYVGALAWYTLTLQLGRKTQRLVWNFSSSVARRNLILSRHVR